MALRVAVRLAVALVCVTGVVVSVTSRESRIAAEEALRYFGATDDVPGTIERLDDARPLNPHSGIEIVEARILPPEQGIPKLRRVLDREPENAELWLALSEAQAKAGDRAAAARSYERARKLAPQFLRPAGDAGG